MPRNFHLCKILLDLIIVLRLLSKTNFKRINMKNNFEITNTKKIICI